MGPINRLAFGFSERSEEGSQSPLTTHIVALGSSKYALYSQTSEIRDSFIC